MWGIIKCVKYTTSCEIRYEANIGSPAIRLFEFIYHLFFKFNQNLSFDFSLVFVFYFQQIVNG